MKTQNFRKQKVIIKNLLSQWFQTHVYIFNDVWNGRFLLCKFFANFQFHLKYNVFSWHIASQRLIVFNKLQTVHHTLEVKYFFKKLMWSIMTTLTKSLKGTFYINPKSLWNQEKSRKLGPPDHFFEIGLWSVYTINH